ncbi:hypothetical protein ACIP5Y_44735 [Nocardia sp. NPDC088792]|uniref:hypothetical protein n=1 Tax=Nocardia sp. NPDC088792 TaxID=3364332 RepID=UPI00382CC512
MSVKPARDLRRYTGTIEAIGAFLGAVIAGLLLMAPLDVGATTGPSFQLDLLVLNMPRAAAAGAVFAAVSAALAIALGRRTAWVVAAGSSLVLLLDRLFTGQAVDNGNLTTVNYVDSIFSGILLGALAVAVFGRRTATSAYLIGALGAILIGDQTSLPSDSGHEPLISWAATASPPLWMYFLAVALLAAGLLLQRPASHHQPNSDLPIGPIVAALLLVAATALSTEWVVRHAGTSKQVTIAAVITVAAAMVAALLLPGRDGMLVLLSVAVTNAGSAIIAVPRPEWSAPLPMIAVVAGLFAGRRRPLPWAALWGTAGLSVFAALTAGTAHGTALVPVLGITVTALLVGYCFGTAVPRNAGSAVVAIAVLIVPCLVVALRGSSFGRIAYSPQWYRDPEGAASAAPGWVALAVTLGCGLGMFILYRLRTSPAVRSRIVARKSLPQAWIGRSRKSESESGPASNLLLDLQRPKRAFTQLSASG